MEERNPHKRKGNNDFDILGWHDSNHRSQRGPHRNHDLKTNVLATGYSLDVTLNGTPVEVVTSFVFL